MRYLITGALPYSNNRLHVGHLAGAYLPADIYVRYLRARGHEVRFICGSDDNGVAAVKTAREQGTTPQELTAHYHARQKADFDAVGIHFDVYGGTHQSGFVELHNALSQEFFRRLHEKGLFSKRRSMQLYDPVAKQFLPDRYVRGTCPHCRSSRAYGDQCEDCGRSLEASDLVDPCSEMTGAPAELRETVHWYLRLDLMQDRLHRWLLSKREASERGPAWRTPALSFSLALIENGGLPERCMTRDLDWGVPVPLADPDANGKAIYVWFEAPVGYVSFTAKYCQDHEGDPAGYKRWWQDPDCHIVHFIGEDNAVFHLLTWPAVLMATHDSGSLQGELGEYQLPTTVVTNCFLNIKLPGRDEEKISKSRGAAIWIEEHLKSHEADPLRYYLTAIAPENQRTAFNLDDFIQRNNTELVATLGNFVHRTLTFADRYFGRRVPDGGHRGDSDRKQIASCEQATLSVGDYLDGFRFKAALKAAMDLAAAGNKYFDAQEPWVKRKTDIDACATAINVCCQTVKTLTALVAPFLPFSAAECLDMLALDETALQWNQAVRELPSGHGLGEPRILFRKIEPNEAPRTG